MSGDGEPDMTAGGGDLLMDRLRAVTRPAHERLEGSAGLLSPEIDLSTYAAILERFHGFWRVWQPQVAGLLDEPALVAPRQRLHLIEADLISIGRSPAAIGALPPCSPVPLHTKAEALGSLYVMEGSTLGGRVIMKHIVQRFGDHGLASCTYFGGYGTETGAMWRRFMTRLSQAPAAEGDAIVRGAAATFAHLDKWLAATSTAPAVPTAGPPSRPPSPP